MSKISFKKPYGPPIIYHSKEHFIQSTFDHWADDYSGELEELGSRIRTIEGVLSRAFAKTEIEELSRILEITHWDIEELNDDCSTD